MQLLPSEDVKISILFDMRTSGKHSTKVTSSICGLDKGVCLATVSPFSLLADKRYKVIKEFCKDD